MFKERYSSLSTSGSRLNAKCRFPIPVDANFGIRSSHYWLGTSGIIECGPCPVGAFFGIGATGVDGVDCDCAFVDNPTTCTPVTL